MTEVQILTMLFSVSALANIVMFVLCDVRKRTIVQHWTDIQYWNERARAADEINRELKEALKIEGARNEKLANVVARARLTLCIDDYSCNGCLEHDCQDNCTCSCHDVYVENAQNAIKRCDDTLKTA